MTTALARTVEPASPIAASVDVRSGAQRGAGTTPPSSVWARAERVSRFESSRFYASEIRPPWTTLVRQPRHPARAWKVPPVGTRGHRRRHATRLFASSATTLSRWANYFLTWSADAPTGPSAALNGYPCAMPYASSRAPSRQGLSGPPEDAHSRRSGAQSHLCRHDQLGHAARPHEDSWRSSTNDHDQGRRPRSGCFVCQHAAAGEASSPTFFAALAVMTADASCRRGAARQVPPTGMSPATVDVDARTAPSFARLRAFVASWTSAIWPPSTSQRFGVGTRVAACESTCGAAGDRHDRRR